jgi:hypothetical protein
MAFEKKIKTMNARPKLANTHQLHLHLLLRQRKIPADQWCPDCWTSLPTFSAMHYSRATKNPFKYNHSW